MGLSALGKHFVPRSEYSVPLVELQCFILKQSASLYPMILGEVLTRLMKERALTLAKLSRLSGVPKTSIHGWMTGRKAMDLDQLKRVASVLEVSLHELAYGEEDPFAMRKGEILKELFSGDVRVTIHKIER